MTENLKNVIQKLIELKLGEEGRLRHVLAMLNNQRSLYNSDKRYVETLISKYLGKDITSQILQFSDKVVSEKNQRQDISSDQEWNERLQKNQTPKCNSIVLSFFKSKPDIKLDAGLLIARIGIAFTFLWAGFGKASNPAGFGQVLQGMIGLEPATATTMSLMIGVLELASGGLVLLGFITRPAAIFQAIILGGAIAMFGFDLTAGPAIWKDSALIGLVILLVLYGAGRLSIDNVIANRIE